MLKDILLNAGYANFVDRLTKGAKKNGFHADECAAVFAAVTLKRYPLKWAKAA
jgi:hypothetical protein